MTFKQKKRVKNTANRYLRPGALAQLCHSKNATISCTDIGKKRIVLDSIKAGMDTVSPLNSPIRTDFHSLVEEIKQQKQPGTPKTPQAFESDSESRLESLPTDLLVKILCHLHHDQLRASFHVSQRIRTAVILARQFHFNYTTPDRSRQELLMTTTPLPNDRWPFASKGIQVSTPRTPKAPRHLSRLPHLQLLDFEEIAAVLFPDSTLPSRFLVSPSLSRPFLRSVASTRVLF